MLLTLDGSRVTATMIKYLPALNFDGNIKDINAENFNSKKFTGKIIFQKLGEEGLFIWQLDNGKIKVKFNGKYLKNKNLKIKGWMCNTICQDTDWYQLDPYTQEWYYTGTTTECWEECYYVSDQNNGGGGDGGNGGGDYDPYDCNNDPSWPWCNNNGGGGSNFGDDAASPGQKPIAEYVNDKCGGAVGMWNMGLQNNNHEVYGVLTQDGSLLITQISPNSTGGSFEGLYSHNGTTYYWYPANGNPTPQYAGTVTAGNKYFIPISATIHTHTPCVNDGTDGISGSDGADDFPFAGQFSGINHFVLGCNGGAAQYNSGSYFNHQTGNHSNTCNIIH